MAQQPSLPYGLKQQSLQAGAVRNMTSEKLTSFALGGTKKTAFQKHKEALEAKRKMEEDAAAAELAQWQEDFESEASDKPKRFVRGGVIQHGDAQREGGPPPGPPRGGAPPRRGPSGSARAMFSQEEDIDGEAIDGDDIDGAPLRPKENPFAAQRSAAGPTRISAPTLKRPSQPPMKSKKDEKPSQMAMFMEELRREQARADAPCRRARDGAQPWEEARPDRAGGPRQPRREGLAACAPA